MQNLDNLLIAGGGRWARVLVGVLMDLIPSTTKLTIYSRNNCAAMKGWVAEQPFKSEIDVVNTLPYLSRGALNAVIVANAVHDHDDVVEWALNNGYHALVEKPICLSLSRAQYLAELAKEKSSYLATAHVFLYASYIEQFRKCLDGCDEITSVQIDWADPKLEKRYDELKKYDSSVPVYVDGMPHVISILYALFGKEPIECNAVELLDGGASVTVHLNYGKKTCKIKLVRNGALRKRLFQIQLSSGLKSCDFGVEPGVIYTDNLQVKNDFNWDKNATPLYLLLKQFLRGVTSRQLDPRLDLSIGLVVVEIIEKIQPLYMKAFYQWLVNELKKDKKIIITAELKYALTEILAIEKRKYQLDRHHNFEYIIQVIKNNLASNTEIKLEEANMLINSLIIQLKKSKIFT